MFGKCNQQINLNKEVTNLWDNWEPAERSSNTEVSKLASKLQIQVFKNHVSSNSYTCLKFLNFGSSPKMIIRTLEISFVIIEVLEYYKTYMYFLCSNKNILKNESVFKSYMTRHKKNSVSFSPVILKKLEKEYSY